MNKFESSEKDESAAQQADSSQAYYCCDRKARAACAQSFALWEQATIEITGRDHSVIACSRHIYVVLFFAHIPFVVNRAFSATPAEWLQHYQARACFIIDSVRN